MWNIIFRFCFEWLDRVARQINSFGPAYPVGVGGGYGQVPHIPFGGGFGQVPHVPHVPAGAGFGGN